jgi:hypothetical protein
MVIMLLKYRLKSVLDLSLYRILSHVNGYQGLKKRD